MYLINNKKFKFSVGIFLLLLCLVIGGSVFAEPSNESKLAEWGAYLKNNIEKKNVQENEIQADDIFARGKNTVITNSEIEQTTKFYMMSGLDEDDAKTQAIEYTKEREALYLAAIQNGYSVTDEEVWTYLDQLKETLNGVDNKDDVMAITNQFDSEEDYWNYEFTVYQKNLPIQNYVADLEKKYIESSENSNDLNSANSIDGDSVYNAKIEEKWLKSFDRLKKELVADEDFEIINQ